MPGSCICSGLPVANCLRQLCPLGTRSLSAQASVCGSRTVGRPEFIRVVQFRPKGRNSLTTFRGQTALRGCPRARGVRCRIAPYRSLCSPPTLPAGRFGLRPRPHWGHASLRDSSLRSPAGKKPLIAHFAGEARYVARTLIGKISLAIVRAPNSPFSAVKMGGPFSLRCLSPLCSPAVGVGHTYLLWLERVLATWLFCHAKKGGLCFPTVDGGQAYPLRGGILSWQQRPACVLLHAGLFSEP